MEKKFVKVVLVFVALAVPCLGQISNGGEVVDVIDGRTIVVATRSGRVKVELQFIEVPGVGHKLHDTITDHVRKLLVGKLVELKPRDVFQDRVVARVFFNNVDVSQQMLRDGAARHVPREISGQGKGEFDLYASLEAAAKTEKRGVWSITDAFPTRPENETAERPRPVLASAGNRGAAPGLGVLSVAPNLEAWVAALPVSEKGTGLETHTDPGGRYTAISTPQAVFEFVSESGKQRVECRAVYASVNSTRGRGEPLFVLGLRSGSKESDLLKGSGNMTVVAERYVVPLTLLANDAAETRYFRISKAFLLRIANTRSVELQINGYKAILSEDAKEFFKQLLAAAQ